VGYFERERPDLRFIYVTHELAFALSRHGARYVLANPKDGLKVLALREDLPDDVTNELLGAASLSFYASRIVFTEGTSGSIDDKLYGAWFRGRDTVARAVGSCEMVQRCTDGLSQSGIAHALQAQGIIDGDFHSDAFRTSRPSNIHILRVHEAESLICLPDVVEAVAKHLGRTFDSRAYAESLTTSITASDRHRVIIERWKSRIEPELRGLTRTISNRAKPIDDLLAEVGDIFEQSNWTFLPTDILKEEKVRVEEATAIEDVLAVMPGKAFIAVAASTVGQSTEAYKDLVVAALVAKEGPLLQIGAEVEAALAPHLPSRTVA
jgi:hypothetical protein